MEISKEVLSKISIHDIALPHDPTPEELCSQQVQVKCNRAGHIAVKQAGNDKYELVWGIHNFAKMKNTMKEDNQEIQCIIIDEKVPVVREVSPFQAATVYSSTMEKLQKGTTVEKNAERDQIGKAIGYDSSELIGISARSLAARYYGITEVQLQRYLWLNALLPEFQESVLTGKIAISAGAQIGSLPKYYQKRIFAEYNKQDGDDKSISVRLASMLKQDYQDYKKSESTESPSSRIRKVWEQYKNNHFSEGIFIGIDELEQLTNWDVYSMAAEDLKKAIINAIKAGEK